MEEEPFNGTSRVPFECRSANILLRCIVACCIKCIAEAGVCKILETSSEVHRVGLDVIIDVLEDLGLGHQTTV